VRAAIENDLPRLRVFAYQDLTPSTTLQHIGTVS
jgi:hypothetical protein